MYVLLRRQLLPNPDTTGQPLLCLEQYWDTVARTYHFTQEPVDSGTPFELALGAEVDRWVVRAGKVRVVAYAGDGRVNTRGARGAQICTIRPALLTPARGLRTVDTGSNPIGPPDGYVKVFGQNGVPPYQFTVLDKNGAIVASATRKTGQLPLEVFNLDTAISPYVVHTKDAAGCESTRLLEVVLGAPTGVPYGELLQDVHRGDGMSSGRGTRAIWNYVTKAVEYYDYEDSDPGDSDYNMPADSLVDGYLLADGVTFRIVRTRVGVDIYFEDTTPKAGGSASLDNLILFHPDTKAEQNGGALVEVNSTDATTFTLTGTAGGAAIAPQTNDTGSFDGLAAGDYEVDCNGLKVPFSLKLRYGLRWQRDFADPKGVPQRVELWLRDYAGVVEEIKGDGNEPVLIETDALTGTLGGQGDVPPVVGTSCKMRFRVLASSLEEIVVNDDRACRCDVYSAGKLAFRGYVQPDIYNAPLLSGLVPIPLTATDGLAGLKEVDFLGHISQRLQGRRPLLNTVLHVLSRCDISLPVQLFVNRRSTEMSDADAPERAATTERNGYWQDSKQEAQDMRTGLDALSQALGGTLCQREGTWQVRSLLEALDDAPGRAYRPAGTPVGTLKATAPTGTIKPLARPGTVWGWRTANQQQQVRPGWKSLTGKTDVGWLKNAFPAGEVFSDKNSWLADGSRLRPIAGWRAGTSDSFPLVLVQGGEKGTDYQSKWPRLAGISDERYLVSPALPLVAMPEGCPAYLNVTAQLLATTYLPNGAAAADSAAMASLRLVLVLDGQPLAAPLLVQVPLAAKQAAKAATITLPLPPLPAGTQTAVLWAYPWQPLAKDGEVAIIQYDPMRAYKTGEIIRYQATAGYVSLYQAKQDLFAPVSPGAAIPPGQLPLGTRQYDAAYTTYAGTYITYNGEYYLAKRDLYIPSPPPPLAPTSNDDYAYVLRADIADEYWQPIDIMALRGTFLVSEIGIELRPQQATWDSEDNFRADGSAGTIRPTEVLDVYHPDVPIQAGLFEGNRHAFSRAVALADGSLTTAWARAIDLRPAPLFESNVYDALALRTGPSRLLTGIISHHGHAGPLLLDSVDTPFDVPGHRFGVGATSWNLRLATTEVSLIEIGAGADAPDPLIELPEGARVIHQVYEYKRGFFTPVVRTTQDGQVRVRHI